MSLIYLDNQVLQEATQVCEESAERQIEQQFVDKWVIQLQNREDYNSRGILHHSLTMVEKFTCYRQQRKVVRASIHEKLDRCMVDTQS